MGAFLDKPKTEKHNESGEGNGLQYGLASMQGWRVEMEDAHCALTSLPGNLGAWSFYGVFDGHAGASVGERCASMLYNAISHTDEFTKIDPELVPSVEDIRKGIHGGFLTLDEELRKMPEVQSGEDKSGSTAVCCLISPEHIFFANCGDSRALLISGGQVVFSTVDHKPGNPEERMRIENAGGSVMIQRVNGCLAVSRSLGDYDYKKVQGRGPTEQLVSPEPEVTIVTRNREDDEFIVLACDGIWDVMSNEELNEYVQHRLKVSNDCARVCNEVVDTCLYKGSRDNMSIVIVTLDNAPKVDPVMAENDKKLDAEIVSICEQFLADPDHSDADLNQLVTHLHMANLKNLPPGGMVTKRHLIEACYGKHHSSTSNTVGSNGNTGMLTNTSNSFNATAAPANQTNGESNVPKDVSPKENGTSPNGDDPGCV